MHKLSKRESASLLYGKKDLIRIRPIYSGEYIEIKNRFLNRFQKQVKYNT